MKKNFVIALIFGLMLISCDDDASEAVTSITPSFSFSQNFNGSEVTSTDLNDIKFENENGENLSIERLRYLISDVTFTNNDTGEIVVIDEHHLIDLSKNETLSYNPNIQIPRGNYNVSFTFGLNNTDNAQNYLDLNSVSFNVPDMLGGGYHYMQFDGKFINSSSIEQSFNYHSIRAVDNPGANPTFPQDTFFNVDLGDVIVTQNFTLEIKMDIAEWFKSPNLWDLNVLNQMLMPNSMAQILISENGRSVFSLGTITQ